jgi:hypothetical protein
MIVRKPKKNPSIHKVGREMVFFGIIILLIVIVGMTLISCNPIESFNDWIGLKDDHIAEEILEEVIEHQTGVEVDLTERSPE